MKRSLFRVGAALATLALAGTLAACSNNSSSSSTDKPAASSSAAADPAAPAPGEDAGFEEQPLGDDVHVGPLVVGGVYFQPVDMEPEVGTPAAESSMHIEADVSAAADNKLGYRGLHDRGQVRYRRSAGHAHADDRIRRPALRAEPAQAGCGHLRRDLHDQASQRLAAAHRQDHGRRGPLLD